MQIPRPHALPGCKSGVSGTPVVSPRKSRTETWPGAVKEDPIDRGGSCRGEGESRAWEVYPITGAIRPP